MELLNKSNVELREFRQDGMRRRKGLYVKETIKRSTTSATTEKDLLTTRTSKLSVVNRTKRESVLRETGAKTNG
jgi:hypothetical protein